MAALTGWAACCWVRQGCSALPSLTAAAVALGSTRRGQESGAPLDQFGSAQALHRVTGMPRPSSGQGPRRCWCPLAAGRVRGTNVGFWCVAVGAAVSPFQQTSCRAPCARLCVGERSDERRLGSVRPMARPRAPRARDAHAGPQPRPGCYVRCCCYNFQGVNLVGPAPPAPWQHSPAPLPGHRGCGSPSALRAPGAGACSVRVAGSLQAAAPGARVHLAPGPPARLGEGSRKAEPSPLPAPQAGGSVAPALTQWPSISGSEALVTVRAEREGLIRESAGRALGSRAGTSLPISRAFHGNGSDFPPLLGCHSHAARTTSVKTRPPHPWGSWGRGIRWPHNEPDIN